MNINSKSQNLSTLLAAYAALPTQAEILLLLDEGGLAETRGYYLPDEDDRLRETYTRYLAIRSVLWGLVKSTPESARKLYRNPNTDRNADWRDFAIAFCAAEMIVRSGEYLIDLARNRPIIWEKLNEADQRYDLKRKNFSRLYRQLTSAIQMRGFYRACEFYDTHRAKVEEAAPQEIIVILENLNLPSVSRGDHLRRYHRFFRHSLKRRGNSALKNIVFSVFEMLGSDIADLKIPLVKPPKSPKRVTPKLIKTLKRVLKPGDVLVTRHDDAMSNLFLPGFWPHTALWVGDADADIVEAKKDGVRLRRVEETLQVDAFTILRPKLPSDDIQKALTRARSHVGKLYDFIFDFRTTDKLVCTEVIYRAYHDLGSIQFNLIQQAGRHCLPAEELLNQALSNDWFEVVAVFGLEGEDLLFGQDAKEKLRESFDSRF